MACNKRDNGESGHRNSLVRAPLSLFTWWPLCPSSTSNLAWRRVKVEWSSRCVMAGVCRISTWSRRRRWWWRRGLDADASLPPVPSLGVVSDSLEGQQRGAARHEAMGHGASGEAYRMVLFVRSLIHWGTGRFCFCALASFCLVRNDLWLYPDASWSACDSSQHQARGRRLPQGGGRGGRVEGRVWGARAPPTPWTRGGARRWRSEGEGLGVPTGILGALRVRGADDEGSGNALEEGSWGGKRGEGGGGWKPEVSFLAPGTTQGVKP